MQSSEIQREAEQAVSNEKRLRAYQIKRDMQHYLTLLGNRGTVKNIIVETAGV